MKMTKPILPTTVLIFAIGAAFTTPYSKYIVEVRPDHFSGPTACYSCAVPNVPGNVYGVHYGCNTIQVSNITCTCLFGSVIKDATSHGIGGSTCAPLWRYQIIP